MKHWIESLKEAGRNAERGRGVWWLLPVGLIIGTALYGYLVANPNLGAPSGYGSPRWAQDQ